MIKAFLHNMTLIVTITFILISLRDYLMKWKPNQSFKWLISLTTGIFSVAIMQEQFHVDGYLVDLRSVPLLIISYMFGFRTGILAAILPSLFRYYQAGSLPYVAIIVTILVPVLLGALFHRPDNKSYLKLFELRRILQISVSYYIIHAVVGFVISKLPPLYWLRISGATLLFGTISCVIIYLMINAAARKNINAHEMNTAVLQKEAILQSASEVAIISTDLDGVITSFNPGAEKMLGYTQQEMLEHEQVKASIFHDFIELEARAKEVSSMQQREVSPEQSLIYNVKDGQTERRNWSMIRKDGSVIKASLILAPMYDYEQNQTGYLGVAIDVTEEIKLREELAVQFELLEEQNEEIFSQQEQLQFTLKQIQSHGELVERILDANHEAMIMSDSQGIIQFANQRMIDYFGFKPMRGETIMACCERIHHYMLVKNTKLFEQVKYIVEGNSEEIKVKFTYNSLQGQRKVIELIASSIGNAREQTREILFVFLDRTEQEQLDEMKSDLISVISHELRTPLSSILGFIEILLHRDIPQEKQDKYLEIVHREANRLTDLLNDFLDIQRMESGRQDYHFAPTDVTVLVHEAIEQWQRKPHYIELSIPPEDMIVRGDNQKLQQVLHNLISNAVKYSPDAEKIHIGMKQTHDEVQIDVTDYGLGIPEKDISQLFTKFFRVEHSDRMQIRGTGLGLSICKEIVQAHGGILTVKSELGQGSTFTIHLKKLKLGI
ncbi:ATP-binding protein [Paenibacillus eucommiae]|uniref:histidine kinase n=1 Tax=Paenibacillus eucommiae TaxID=1355755 RepID=A0ABS4J6S2_9BACL|nr:ATP-binding protein [Paenibacillus eucommiae]MBP1995505.1 PAS domain S-box-containing protein [Paenibacillus eucommiae]